MLLYMILTVNIFPLPLDIISFFISRVHLCDHLLVSNIRSALFHIHFFTSKVHSLISKVHSHCHLLMSNICSTLFHLNGSCFIFNLFVGMVVIIMQRSLARVELVCCIFCGRCTNIAYSCLMILTRYYVVLPCCITMLFDLLLMRANSTKTNMMVRISEHTTPPTTPPMMAAMGRELRPTMPTLMCNMQSYHALCNAMSCST